MKYKTFFILLLQLLLVSCASVAVLPGSESDILLEEHFVPVVSLVPSMTGSVSNIYVRERIRANVFANDRSLNELEGQVVLFIHVAGTPAEIAFDVPAPGYSWMAYLAERGIDVFSMDMTGYGRSTRPLVMNDRCNLSAEEDAGFLLEIFGDEVGKYFYNRGLNDAQAILLGRMDNITEAI